MKDLRNTLALFDGRHTDVLERVAADLAGKPGAVGQLLSIAEADPDEPIAVAATWVILALYKDTPPSAGASIAVRLGRLLGSAGHWETRLHALQTLGRMELNGTLSKPQLRSLATAAMSTAHDPKPFVRAWSLSLLAIIGGSLGPDLRRRAAALIDAAEDNEPASVKARLRQLRKSGALLWMPSASS